MTRRYELKRRAESQEATRQKIIDAAIALHQTRGPRATSMADIAELASVSRVTVYRHFSDEIELAGACSAKYYRQHPFPDPQAWLSIADAATRLEAALLETYAFHRDTRAMTERVLADGRDHPVMAPYHAFWREAGEVLVASWRLRGRRQQAVRAAIAVALSFDTWRTLAVQQGLDDQRAAAIVVGWVTASAR
jgi:AcrR family transcriptional regulator